MILYTNGCSFVYGQELQNPTISAWPSILSKKLNVEVKNDALCGSSNERIFRTTNDFICNNYKKYKNELFVVIGWSLSDRYELFHQRLLKYIQIMNYNEKIGTTERDSVSELENQIIHNFHNLFKSDDYINEQTSLRYIIAIYALCNLFQIPLIMFNSIWPFISSKQLLNIFDKIQNLKKHKFHNFHFYENANLIQIFQHNNWINETFMDFTVINKFSIGENSHPLEEAHEAWANYLYNYIITNDILNKK